MKVGRILVLSLMGVGAVASVPSLSSLAVRSAVQRQMGKELAFERCSVNLFNGAIYLHDGSLPSRDERSCRSTSLGSSPSTSPGSTLRFDQLWTKGIPAEFLYGRFKAPLSVISGLQIDLDRDAPRKIPSVLVSRRQYSTPPLTIEEPKPPTLADEFEAIFLEGERQLAEHRQSLEKWLIEVESIEQRTGRNENPLRFREEGLAAQRQLSNISQSLTERQDQAKRLKEEYVSKWEAADASQAEFEERSMDDVSLPAIPVEVVRNEAEQLFEKAAAAMIERLTPYLATSRTIVEDWLIEEEYPAPNRPLDKSAHSFPIAMQPMPRGSDYYFNEDHRSAFLFESIKIAGMTNTANGSLPFSGMIRQMGGSALEGDHSPSIDLLFPPQSEHRSLPRVAMQSSVIPGRRGFTLKSQVQPTGKHVIAVQQGDWKLECEGDDVLVHLTWLTDEAQWRFELDVEMGAGEIIVQPVASPSFVADFDVDRTSVAQPEIEVLETSSKSTLVRGTVTGQVVPGGMPQTAIQMTTSLIEPVVASMCRQRQQTVILAKRERAQRDKAANIALRQNCRRRIDDLCRDIESLEATLSKRLETCDAQIASTLRLPTDARYSRQPSAPLTR